MARGADPRQHRRGGQLRAARIPRRPGARAVGIANGCSKGATTPKGSWRSGSTRWSAARPAPCIARDIGVADHIRLGKQARDDGAHDSDNMLGDVMEALLGANFLDAGFDADARPRPAAVGRSGRGPRAAVPSIPRARCRNGPRATAASRPNTSWSTARAPITAPLHRAGESPQRRRGRRARRRASRTPKPRRQKHSWSDSDDGYPHPAVRLRRGDRRAQRGQVHPGQRARRPEGRDRLRQGADHPRPAAGHRAGQGRVAETQMVLVDTPGIFAPHRRLDRAMVSAAWEGAEAADAVLLVVDPVKQRRHELEPLLEALARGPSARSWCSTRSISPRRNRCWSWRRN